MPANVEWRENRLYNLDADAFYIEETDGGEIAPSVFFASRQIEQTVLTKKNPVILDLFFDQGLNFLLCLSLKAVSKSGRLDFASVSERPLEKEDLRKLLACFPQHKKEAALLLERWPAATPGLHRMEFPEQHCTLDLYYGDPLVFLENWRGRFDLGLLGGFKPESRPSAWRPKLYYLMAQLARNDSTLLCRHDSQAIRQGLQRAGFKVDTGSSSLLSGFHKVKSPIESVALDESIAKQKRVAVVGAGMAGVWASFLLALEGFEVILLDTAERVCQGASGNAAGAFHPHLSIDDARMSKITRVGVSATLETLCLLTQAGLLKENVDWGRTGHVQLFDDEQDEARFVKALQTLQFPREWVCLLDQQQASERLGFQTRMGGLYFSEAGWLKPVQWCEAALAYIRLKNQADTNSEIGSISFMPGCEVLSLRLLETANCLPAERGVELQLSDSTLAVDHVVIAAAQNSLDVFNQSDVVVNTVKGQVSVVGTDMPLKTVLSGASYAISFNEKELLIGATFERPCKSLEVTFQAHQENYQKLQRVFPENTFAFPTQGRSALRCAWLDRMPAIGCAINEVGESYPQILYSTGFGSRGMTWAVLAGKLLAARLSGRPSPLTQDLEAAVLPGRFFSRASNSKPTPPSGLRIK